MKKSGRREAFGANMFALKDRYQKRYVMGPTHEELFTIAATMKGSSYKDSHIIYTRFKQNSEMKHDLAMA